MDRDTALDLLDDLVERTPEELTCIERMISRLKQGGTFPYNPADEYRMGDRRYTYDDLYEVSDEIPSADWEHQESGTEDWEHQSDWTIVDDVITIDDVNRAKEYLVKQELEIWTAKMNCVDINWATPIQLDNLPCPPISVPCAQYKAYTPKKAKEQQMNCYQTPAYNEVQQAKKHLTRRVDETYYTFGDKLHEAFNMGHARPKNVKQAKDWLARGGMVIDNPENDDNPYVNVQWQDPDKPRNAEGFKFAQMLLNKDYQNAKDAILVKTAEDGLKALQEFEAKTYN